MGTTQNADGSLVVNPTPKTVEDMQAIVDMAVQLGGLLKGTRDARLALTSGQARPGWLFSETDTRSLFMRTGDGWVSLASETDWVNASGFANGFTHGAEPVRLKKIGPVVYLRGGVVRVTGGAPSGGVPVFNIPAGWRPGAPVRWSGRRDADMEVIVSGTNLTISSPTLLTSGSGYTLTGLSWVAEA